jgi:cell division protein FtsB
MLAFYVLLALSTVVGQRGILHFWRLQQELETLEVNVLSLLRENKALRDRITRLQHDDEFLEKIVREELGYAREKEFVYRFHDSSASSTP